MINLTTEQLRKTVSIREQIENLESELNSILSGHEVAKRRGRPSKGGMSASGRARIAAAQKARWAKLKSTEGEPKKRRKMSAAAKAKIAANAKARWAKAKAAVEPEGFQRINPLARDWAGVRPRRQMNPGIAGVC